MGEGGGGEDLSSFFASIFPLFPRNAWYSGYVTGRVLFDKSAVAHAHAKKTPVVPVNMNTFYEYLKTGNNEVES